MKYGYIRVSSKDQHIDRQLSAMTQLGLEKSQLYIDKSSGKDFKRKAYQKLLKKVSKGDDIVIKSIDRLGRNYNEILEQWRFLVKERGINIEVLDFPLLNTKNGIDNLTGQLISDLVLQIFSYVSQLEREQTKQRQAEGISEARKKGIKLGRPLLNYPKDFPNVLKQYQDKQLSIREGAMQLGVSKSTFHNWIKRATAHKKCPKE